MIVNKIRGQWRKELWDEHPKAFAVIAAFEIVHWYEFNGLNCLMLNEALVHMVENCKPNIEYLNDTQIWITACPPAMLSLKGRIGL
jgi:cytosine/adenosine deaminase-related metal-dependent hydrolase